MQSIKKCSLDSCNRPAKSLGFCNAHYVRFRKTGDPQEHVPIKGVVKGRICSIEDCDAACFSLGFCQRHYMANRKYGDPLGKRQYKECEPKISSWGYRTQWINGKRHMEHRRIMEESLGRALSPGESVHHINGDRLDNRIENLELWSEVQPAGQRVIDKINFGIQFLESYGYTVTQIDPSKTDLLH